MVSDDYLPNPGGISGHVFELSRALCRLGHEVDLLAGHNRIHQGGAVTTLPTGGRVIRNRAFTWGPIGYSGIAFDTFRRIRKLTRQERYDVVHWHSLIWESPAVGYSARALPRVFTNHSSGFLRRMNVDWRRRLQLPWILKMAHEIIVPSSELEVRTHDAGIAPEHVTMIPNGVDIADFCPGEPDSQLRAQLGLPPTGPLIVAPRRLDPKNGIDVLMRALPAVVAQVPDVCVACVGHGDELVKLQAIVKAHDLGRHVVFCGSQPRGSMPAILRLGRVGVLPSRKEAISLAGLEMLAVGLPLVGSRVGGIPEFLQDPEMGRLVPPDDPQALAQALVEVLTCSHEEHAGMSRRASAHVATEFSWRSAGERTVEVYARASHTARRAPH